MKRFFISITASLLVLSLCGPIIALELKTAAQDSNPKYFLDEEGTLQGLLPDIMRALEKVDPELSFSFMGDNELIPYKRMMIYLELGKIDLFFGMSRNKDREQRFIYPDLPLYQLRRVMVVRSNDPVSVSTLSEIAELGDQGVILTKFGTSAHRYLKNQAEGLGIELEVDNGGKTAGALLLKLMRHRGRFVYYHNLGITAALEKFSLGSHVRILPSSFGKYYHWVAFSKHCPPEKKERVLAALQSLRQSGEFDNITNRYLHF